MSIYRCSSMYSVTMIVMLMLATMMKAMMATMTRIIRIKKTVKRKIAAIALNVIY